MLNYLWSFMIIFSVIMAGFKGGMGSITSAALSASEDAVTICIKTCGVLCMWMGIMRIAEKAGLIDTLAQKLAPVLDFLFPSVPRNHPARKYIATNFVANFLGLGWAATPPGLQAMIELQKLNKTTHTATNAMCMFLIINMSSIQLIPINIISYRASYGSANPAEIIAPCIVATYISTLLAIVFAKLMERRHK